MLCAEDGPVSRKVVLEEVDFGDEEEDGDGAGEEVRSRVEEEEVILHASHDDHHPACGHHGEQTDDVEASKDVEDHKAGAPDLGRSRQVKHGGVVLILVSLLVLLVLVEDADYLLDNQPPEHADKMVFAGAYERSRGRVGGVLDYSRFGGDSDVQISNEGNLVGLDGETV